MLSLRALVLLVLGTMVVAASPAAAVVVRGNGPAVQLAPPPKPAALRPARPFKPDNKGTQTVRNLPSRPGKPIPASAQ